jgi:hypothetical protein
MIKSLRASTARWPELHGPRSLVGYLLTIPAAGRS